MYWTSFTTKIDLPFSISSSPATSCFAHEHKPTRTVNVQRSITFILSTFCFHMRNKEDIEKLKHRSLLKIFNWEYVYFIHYIIMKIKGINQITGHTFYNCTLFYKNCTIIQFWNFIHNNLILSSILNVIHDMKNKQNYNNKTSQFVTSCWQGILYTHKSFKKHNNICIKNVLLPTCWNNKQR